ncbi:MAG: UDP-3-O-acyl-N-acetylglucosamine deacetylase [candidate division WOR-3 bacterium]
MRSSATIRQPVILRGIGPFSQRPVRLRLSPAPPGTGILLNGVAVCPENACVCRHTTGIRMAQSSTVKVVGMVEHLLATCQGMGVTDLVCETDDGELPLGDGSGQIYIAAIRRAGIVKRGNGLVPISLPRPVLVTMGHRFIAAVPAARLRISCLVRFPGIGPQFFSFISSPARFLQELALARTALPIGRKAVRGQRLAHLARRFRLRFRLKRIGGLVLPARERFENELCRHKLLDLLGDLALLGRPLQAELFAFQPGHRLNHAFVRLLSKRRCDDH